MSETPGQEVTIKVAGRQSGVRVGDVVAIPVDRDRIAVMHVVGTYKNEAYYFAIFDQLCKSKDLSCVEATLEGQIVLLALSMDAKVFAGHWTVVGHRDVDAAEVPFPAYIEGTSPPGSFEVVDYSGTRRRPASQDDARDLSPRKVVAPVRLENAIRALHGLEPWTDAYEELRVPAEPLRSTFRFRKT